MVYTTNRGKKKLYPGGIWLVSPDEYEGTILPSRLLTPFQLLGYKYYHLISCSIISSVKDSVVKYTKNSYFPSFRAFYQLNLKD